MRPMVTPTTQLMPLGKGEEQAAIEGLPDGFESEQHRSVVVITEDFPRNTPPVIIRNTIKSYVRKPRPTYPPGLWTVTLIEGLEGSAGIPLPYGFSVGGQLTHFKIKFHDQARGYHRKYYLSVGCLKADWGAPFSIESLRQGPPQPVRMDKELRVTDLEGFCDVFGASVDGGVNIAGIGYVTTTREMEPSGELAYVRFPIPPGRQDWEFGKFGVGVSTGKGYLSPAD